MRVVPGRDGGFVDGEQTTPRFLLRISKKFNKMNFPDMSDSFESVLNKFLQPGFAYSREQCENMEVDMLNGLGFRLLSAPLLVEWLQW